VSIHFRDLTTRNEFASVVELERQIWGPGYDDVVPIPILIISVKRGGILIGAFDGDRMIGFVYSLPAIRNGRPTQWSHMLGVLEEYRADGVGYRLKLMQRDRAIAMGLDLIEWTFDPMQALNAHLNFTKLGVVVEEYEENVYGESKSPLHKGNPTDRFIAEWWIREARPEHDWSGAAAINRGIEASLDRNDARVMVEIPMGFTDMLLAAPDHALAWRMATRTVFSVYFSRGYRAVDFRLDRAARKGTYLLVRA
jgi:predicted GNAT superfamily acetyltransferase